MPGWFDRRLDRELGPAPGDGREPVRDPWLRDWPLLLGLVLSALLVAASLLVSGPNAAPAKAPAAAASAGSAIPGEVVDVGEGDVPAPEAVGPSGDTKKPKRRYRDTPVKTGSSADETPEASPGGGTAEGDVSEGSNAGGGREPRSSGPGSSAPSTPAPRGGSSGSSGGGSGGGGPSAPATPGKIVNVTGTSASFTNGPLVYSFRAPTHTPTVGKPWILSIGVERAGKPLAGRVKVDILHQGSVVGRVTEANLRGGRFAHKFDWPQRAVGPPLTVKTTVVGGGFQQSFLFNVRVKAAG